VWASKNLFVTMVANRDKNELANGTEFPSIYTFRLEPGVPAGGRVVDEQGKPIAGARVQVVLANRPKPDDGDGRLRYNDFLALENEAATTDAQGRWRIDNVPAHPDVN
jgi:Carboxypeptidase regulatory-like domain